MTKIYPYPRYSFQLPPAAKFDGLLFSHPQESHLTVLWDRRKFIDLIDGEWNAFPPAQAVWLEQEKMRRAFLPTRACRNDPDRRGAGVYLVVDIEVVDRGEAAPVGAEIKRLLMLPNTRLQFSEIGGKAPNLFMITPESLHQAIDRQSRRLFTLKAPPEDRDEDKRDDEGGHGDTERYERDPDLFASRLVHCRPASPPPDAAAINASPSTTGDGAGPSID